MVQTPAQGAQSTEYLSFSCPAWTAVPPEWLLFLLGAHWFPHWPQRWSSSVLSLYYLGNSPESLSDLAVAALCVRARVCIRMYVCM